MPSSDLGRALADLTAKMEAAVDEASRLEALDAATRRLVRIWPLIVVLLAGAIVKLGLTTLVQAHWSAALLLSVVPEAAAGAVGTLARKRATVLSSRHAAYEASRRHLCDRVKAELPMAAAVALLLEFDASGDHRAFVENPPHLVEQIDRLTAERDRLVATREELLRALDATIMLLGTHVEGGWGGAGVLLSPLAPTLKAHRTALPALTHVLDANAGSGGLDTWILSRIVATPARGGDAAVAARTAAAQGRAAAIEDKPGPTPGALGTAARLGRRLVRAIMSPGGAQAPRESVTERPERVPATGRAAAAASGRDATAGVDAARGGGVSDTVARRSSDENRTASAAGGDENANGRGPVASLEAAFAAQGDDDTH